MREINNYLLGENFNEIYENSREIERMLSSLINKIRKKWKILQLCASRSAGACAACCAYIFPSVPLQLCAFATLSLWNFVDSSVDGDE